MNKSKKTFGLVAALGVLTATLLTGCHQADTEPATKTTEATKTETTEANTTEIETTDAETTKEETTEAETMGTETEDAVVRVGALKGPTSMGMVSMMDENEQGSTSQKYEFTMAVAADEITTALVKGDLDIALVPANVGAMLYQKTNNQVSVIDVNTLGVLYLVENGETIQSIEDLKGKTIYMTGKGTTPDYVFQYLLSCHGMTTEDVNIEFKSESTEIVGVLAEDEEAIAILPQPFVTVAQTSQEKLRMALDLTSEWAACGDGQMVTGVTIVRNAFLSEHKNQVDQFIADHEASVESVKKDIDKAAELIEKYDIIKAAIAKKAYDYCNIVCLTKTEMKETLSSYLDVLFDFAPDSIGGALPGDDFYYEAEIPE